MQASRFSARAAAFCLAALLSCAAFMSCGETADAGQPSATAAQDGQLSESTETEPVDIYDPGLPEADYGGETFTFHIRGTGEPGFWDVADVWAEDLNGEALNDAIYSRNSFIEEKYNVKIEQSYDGDAGRSSGDYQSKVKKLIQAGEPIDALIGSGYAVGSFAVNGMLDELGQINYIDLTKPWWDRNSVESCSLFDRVFYAAGEITTADNDAVNIIAFVKPIVSDFGLESPYDLVKNGSWTLDKLIELSSAVTSDVDGDGKMTENDRVGWLHFADSCATMWTGLGNFFGIKNAEGMPELSFYNDHSVNSWQRLIDFIATDSTMSMSTELTVYKGQGDYDVIVHMIEGKNTLFTWCHMKNIARLRAVETDFGVIPNPKYDETQTGYFTQNDPYGTGFVCVPISCADTDRAGMIIEAFAAKSAELLTPAYYDLTLQGKYMRDEESLEMLDIIFSTMTYDIGDIMNWGGLMEKMIPAWNKETPDFASLWTKNQAKAETALQKTIDLYSEIG